GSSVWLLTLARLREFRREPSALFWTFGFPLLITVALGVAFRTQGPPETAIAVVEHDGAESVAETLERADRLSAIVLSRQEAMQRLDAGRVALVVELSPASELIYRYDPGRPEALATRALADAALQRAAGQKDARATRDETVRTPGSRYVDWLV